MIYTSEESIRVRIEFFNGVKCPILILQGFILSYKHIDVI